MNRGNRNCIFIIEIETKRKHPDPHCNIALYRKIAKLSGNIFIDCAFAALFKL